MKQKFKTTGSPDLFKNKFLNVLTRTNIAVPLTIFYTSSSIVLLYYILYKQIHISTLLINFFLGILFFTLIEYFVHRVVFHIKGDGEAIQKFQYIVHGVHHEYPKDKLRLAMPPIVSVFLSLILLSFFNFVLGYYGLPFGSGFIFGYALYLSIHYSVHAFSPPNNFLKKLWHHHALHHYQDGETAFGVSSPIWDYIFKTMPRKKIKKAV